MPAAGLATRRACSAHGSVLASPHVSCGCARQVGRETEYSKAAGRLAVTGSRPAGREVCEALATGKLCDWLVAKAGQRQSVGCAPA